MAEASKNYIVAVVTATNDLVQQVPHVLCDADRRHLIQSIRPFEIFDRGCAIREHCPVAIPVSIFILLAICGSHEPRMLFWSNRTDSLLVICACCIRFTEGVQ